MYRFVQSLVLLFVILWGLGSYSSAQNTASISSGLTAGVVRLGGRVALRITVENAPKARVVSVSAVDGLEFGALSGPSSSRQRTVSGGRVTQRISLEWTVQVTPRREGDFEIPGVVIEVGGKEYQTRPQSLRVVKDVTGAELGFLEISATPTRVVEGQAFTVELRFGWDQDALQTSRGSLYAELSLPWWDGLPGLIDVEAPAIKSRSEITINQRERVRVEPLSGVVRNGRNQTAFRLLRRWMPTRSGTIDLTQGYLEFGVRQEGFFRSENLQQMFVGPTDLSVPVVALPEEGRPFDYSGAVGMVRAKANVDSRDVLVGDSIKLTVDWTGSANLEFFDAPDLGRLDAFRGFRVYGTSEEKRLDRRRVIYDLAPLEDELEAIPSIPLVIFDPATMEYSTVATAPIAIRVRPLEGAVSLTDGLPDEERFVEDVEDLQAQPLSESRDTRRWFGDRALGLGVLLLPLGLLLVRGLVRSRRGDPSAPLERRRRRARATLAKSLSGTTGSDDALASFEEFLAARTKSRAEGWLGRRSDHAGGHLNDDASAAVDALLVRLEQASFGGGASVPREEVLAAADRALGGGL